MEAEGERRERGTEGRGVRARLDDWMNGAKA